MTSEMKQADILSRLQELADRVDDTYLALTAKEREQVETAMMTLSLCFDRRRAERRRS